MQHLVKAFEKTLLANKFQNVRVGEGVELAYKFKDGDKERSQKVEGLIIAHKHGQGLGGMITIRSIIENTGVERTFPIHSPFISGVKVKARYKVRRSKLYYLRNLSGKAARLKRIK